MNDDTTKTLTAADILSMAGVKRPSEMQDKDAGLLKLADSIYESDLLKELRKDRQRLDWIQANWKDCYFIWDGNWPKNDLRSEVDTRMK